MVGTHYQIEFIAKELGASKTRAKKLGKLINKLKPHRAVPNYKMLQGLFKASEISSWDEFLEVQSEKDLRILVQHNINHDNMIFINSWS